MEVSARLVPSEASSLGLQMTIVLCLHVVVPLFVSVS